MNLPEGQPFVFTREEEAANPCPLSEVGHYLYEPDVTLMKAGTFRLPTSRFGVQKLHINTHLYTSDTLKRTFPGRIFEVKEVVGFGKKELRRLTDNLQQANLAVRNFPQSVDALRHKLHLAEGGDDYLFATTTKDGEHRIIWCKKV